MRVLSGVALLGLTAPVWAQGTLYFSEDGNFDGLYSISTIDGSATNLGESGVTSSSVGLAPSANIGELYGSTWTELAVIQADGSGHAVVGTSNAEGLAYDAMNDILYGGINGDFFSINQGNGVQTPLASPGEDVEGFAYGNGVVYGMADNSGNLYSYDAGGDIWSLIGNTGVGGNASGLAYDPFNDVLYYKSEISTMLYAIDVNDASASVIGDTGLADGGGLAYVVPAPGVSALLLGGLGLVARRRR